VQVYSTLCDSCAELLHLAPVGRVDRSDSTCNAAAASSARACGQKQEGVPGADQGRRKTQGFNGRSQPWARVALASPSWILVASCLMSSIRRIWRRSFAISVISRTMSPGTALRIRRPRKARGGRVAAASGARPEDNMYYGDF
jgi:hypothetical protein